MGKRHIKKDALSLYETAIMFALAFECDPEELFDLEAIRKEQDSSPKKLRKKNKIKNKKIRR